MSEGTTCDCGKDVNLFQKGQIIGMRQAKKTSQGTAETTQIGLWTAQRFIKNWKDSGEPSSLSKKCGWEKILNDRDRWLLKRLVKSDHNKNNSKTQGHV